MPLLGFVPPIDLAPLAISAMDFIWVIAALAFWIMLAAGYSIYSPIFDILSNISIFGAKPFGFINGLLKAAMERFARSVGHAIVPLAHWLWALVMTIWRPLYLLVATLEGLVEQMVGINQASQSGLAQLRAQEQSDIAALRAQENADIAGVYATIQGDITSLDGAINTVAQDAQANLVNAEGALNARITGDNATLNTRMDNLYNQSISHTDTSIATVNTRINTVNHDLVTALNNDVTSLEQRITNGISTAESFATGLVSGLGVGGLASTLTSLEGRMSAVETDINDCLDPLCETVTPNANQLGNLGKLLKDLEGLFAAGALMALLVAAVEDPKGTATVVQDTMGWITPLSRDLVSVVGDAAGVVL